MFIAALRRPSEISARQSHHLSPEGFEPIRRQLGLQATYNRLAWFDPKRGDAMSPESFWRSAVAIGISVAAIWTVADVIAALVGLPPVAGLDWATRRRRGLAGY